MLREKSGSRFKKENWTLLFPILIIFLISVTLSLSRIIRYRNLDAGLRLSHWAGFLAWIATYLMLAYVIKKKNKNSDFILFSSIQLLIGIGLITIWRLNRLFGFRQSLWLIICSLIAVLLIKKPDLIEILRKYKYVLLIAGLGLIVLTFFFGTYPGGNGPNLWLGANGIYFQPSELLKLILIIYLAAYFAGKPIGNSNIFQFVLPTAILALASIALLIFQRDFGTALIFLSIYILIIFSVYGKRRILLISFVVLLIFAVLGYATIDLIKARFDAWVFPWLDPQAGSYQIIQSIIAIAAGGLLGTGTGLGYPNLIPLSHSDFIFSAIGEELGLFGTIGLLVLLAIILFKSISIALHAKNRYHQYLSIGIISYLITQSILIIGGNIRLLPITGVTLPFASYGGSSLLVSFLSFSILLIIESEQKPFSTVQGNPYKTVAAFFSICLIAISLTLGWWGLVHANDIQLRGDNSRNIIANLFVKRGDIIDRNNTVLAQSVGIPGEIARLYAFPQLSNTIGFSHQKFGVTGIEASYDSYLRGYQGYPSQDIWFSYLLYDQPPEGRSVRLSIDASLQQKSDQLMQGTTGGMILLNANNGEILSISTAPYYDANTLDENWDSWQNDPSAPLLHRATQSAYPAGGLLAPLVLTYDSQVDLTDMNETYISASYDYYDPACSPNDNILTNKIRNGCVSALLNLTEDMPLINYFYEYPLAVLTSTTDIGLDTLPGTVIAADDNWMNLLYGSNTFRSNPLQIAQAFLPLSNQGELIQPSIVSAVNTADAGWVFLEDASAEQAFSSEVAGEISTLLTNEGNNYWELSAETRDTTNEYQWYVAGTGNSQNENNSYILVLALEGASREKAIQIGSEFMLFLNE